MFCAAAVAAVDGVWSLFVLRCSLEVVGLQEMCCMCTCACGAWGGADGARLCLLSH